ncbi:MAG: histidine--tRNA ligase [Clostridia bacterium]|nr:histidine--tRNA ligase [Clostridia bacterium]
MALQALKGMKDVLPNESAKWQYVERIMRALCAKHGFCEIRTPVLEHTELFLRGVGNTTDIVQKEMYTFTDKGDRSVTLRPEGTAGVARAFVEHRMADGALPVKMYYLNVPLFRYERPQAGRLREHHQFGVEMFGAKNAAADAECIALVFELMQELGVKGLRANINSIGCPECRPAYSAALREYLHDNLDNLCETCRTRYEQNPLRILDCKEAKCKEICKNAPKTIDCLCDDCKSHFENLKSCLDVLSIPYTVNPMIVRGLDYYTKTVFEVVSESLGAQSAVCGGGRYDNLVEEVGGSSMPAVGFGMGIERLIIMLENMGIHLPEQKMPDVYIASMGDAAQTEAMKLAYTLRNNGIYAEFDHVGRSFKAQFKYADKISAKAVIVIGESELESGEYKLKDMMLGSETSFRADDVLNAVKNIIG